MDVDELLEETEETFPIPSKAWRAEELSETVKSLTSSLMSDVVGPIHASVKVLLPFKEIQTSHLDAYWYLGKGDILNPMPQICSVRIRPSNEYLGIQSYPMEKPVYSGLAVEFQLYSPLLHRIQKLNHATLDISFMVQAPEERRYFSHLLSEHRGIVREILDASRPNFEGACYSGNRKMTAFNHVEKYYKEDDPENSFELKKSFSRPVETEKIVKTFSLFMILFSGVQIYSKEPKSSMSKTFRKLASKIMDA